MIATVQYRCMLPNLLLSLVHSLRHIAVRYPLSITTLTRPSGPDQALVHLLGRLLPSCELELHLFHSEPLGLRDELQDEEYSTEADRSIREEESAHPAVNRARQSSFQQVLEGI